MTYETLIVERRGPVGWLIFNRPESLNAHNLTMLEELPVAWQELNSDDRVRVIVNTGNGRGFCTGADVREIAAAGNMGERMKKLRPKDGGPRGGITGRRNDVWKPVIVAVNGVCAGGGLGHVADADTVMASSAATFVDTHVSVGQLAALEPISLFGRIPFGELMKLVLVGRHQRLDALQAKQIGLVSDVVEADRLVPAAQELGELMARNSPSAMMASKRAVWRAREMGLSEALAAGLRDVQAFWDHPDNREGPAAFAERREPVWAAPSLPTPRSTEKEGSR
jgi:enoyl-CoA hydratase/carnithine racemase